MFKVLGPPEICGPASTTHLRGPFQITLLGALLLSEKPVSPRALSAELWGDGHPNRPDNALQAHISRLRHLLDELEPSHGGQRIAFARPAGYRLLASDEEVDALTYANTVTALRQDKQLCGRPTELARRLRAALSAWRGPVLGGIIGGRICQAAAARYEDVRLRCLEVLFDAELECGNHVAIIPELSALVRSYTPSLERFSEQLMTALYRAGRQIDALEVYRNARDYLVNEMGTEPSPRLRMHESAVLRHDAALVTSSRARRC
jgi:DNA-binding SARP family transcriptional activator